MPLNLRAVAASAKERTPWYFSNEVLYELCREHPLHKETEVVIAKVLLIGRAYAAAIERRKVDRAKSGDDFYFQRVGPCVMKSSIDRWINRAKGQKPGTPEALRAMVEIHSHTTDLFSDISGLEKRSLASKYLHFHVPALFFIYDSRAVKGIRAAGDMVGRVPAHQGDGDQEYARFAEKCTRLSNCFDDVGCTLTPRELDNALLTLAAK